MPIRDFFRYAYLEGWALFHERHRVATLAGAKGITLYNREIQCNKNTIKQMSDSIQCWLSKICRLRFPFDWIALLLWPITLATARVTAQSFSRKGT